MFSPLATRAQQPAFLFLCTGLFFLAISDSLLGYYNLSSGFNTGTLQDVLWPASMQLIGLAAIEYPISISQEQRNNIPSSLPAIPALFTSNRLSQVLSIVLATLPLILILMTCALLLVNVSPRGGIVSLQSNLVVLALVLILIARQTLTLLENNRLIRQIHSKLVVSQGELDRKRREVDEAVRRMREKLEAKLEEDVKALRSVHSRVAHGDFSVRAPAISGPLQPVALSFNMMQDRLSSLTQQSTYHRQLAQEFRMVQEAIERLEQGLPAWSSSQPPAQCTRELRPVFLGLLRLQYSLLNQWRNLESALESVNSLARHLREGLSKMAHAKSFTNSEQSSTEHMLLELVISEATILEQQLKTVLNQVLQSIRRFESSTLPMQRLRSGDGSEPR